VSRQERQIGVVGWNGIEHRSCIGQQVAVQAARFSGAGDFAGPDVQAIGLFTMEAEFFKAFLQPLPVLLAFCLGEHGGFRVFLRVALEDAGADEIGGVVHRMHQGSGVVDDEFARGDSVFEPGHEVFGGWGG